MSLISLVLAMLTNLFYYNYSRSTNCGQSCVSISAFNLCCGTADRNPYSQSHETKLARSKELFMLDGDETIIGIDR